MEQKNRTPIEKSDPNTIQQMIAKFLPYWPLLLVLTFLSVAGAYIYLRYAPRIYEAAASVLIKDFRKGSDDASTLESTGFFESKKNYDNEIRVLQSRSLMEDVVKRLALYAPLSRKGKVKSGDAYQISPIIVEAENPDLITTEAEDISFSYDKNSQIITVADKYKYPINQMVNTPYGKLKFSPNKNYIPEIEESNKQLSFSLFHPSKVALSMDKNFAVVGSASALVDLIYKDAMPQRAVSILNNLIDIYEKQSIEDKNALSKSTLVFLNDQLQSTKKDIDSIAKKVQEYKSSNNAVGLGEQSQAFLHSVADNDTKLGELKRQSDMLRQVENYATSKASDENGASMVPSTLGISDPTLITLTNELYNKQQEYDKLKKTYGEGNPKLTMLADEIGKIKPTILNNIKNQESSLNAARQSISSTNSEYIAKLSTVPTKEKELIDISRQEQTKNNLYLFLLQKKQNAELTLANNSSGIKLIDAAIAGKDPVSPNKKMIYLLALVTGAGLFAATIIAKDMLSSTIKYRSEIEKATAIPVIGEIPYEKSESALVIAKGTRSFIAEAFRKLRISLSFLGIDPAHRKLLITSSISGEGKSFTAANLAVSLSLTGKKVILVDLDLNNPTQSKIFGVNYEEGVSEFLNGEKAPTEIINKLPAYENLYFISAGSLPENPTELLANGKVKGLIEYLDNNYDVVLIDTSPSALVTDAFILSEMCDATLYVVRHNYTPKRLVNRIDETNEINTIHNPAIIFNGLKARGVFKHNYGYGYDYVYGNKERGAKGKKVY